MLRLRKGKVDSWMTTFFGGVARRCARVTVGKLVEMVVWVQESSCLNCELSKPWAELALMYIHARQTQRLSRRCNYDIIAGIFYQHGEYCESKMSQELVMTHSLSKHNSAAMEK